MKEGFQLLRPIHPHFGFPMEENVISNTSQTFKLDERKSDNKHVQILVLLGEETPTLVGLLDFGNHMQHYMTIN
jgi:hypothetical protein